MLGREGVYFLTKTLGQEVPGVLLDFGNVSVESTVRTDLDGRLELFDRLLVVRALRRQFSAAAAARWAKTCKSLRCS